MLSGMQWLDASVMSLIGLLIGSFLNVVVYRMPKMMERQWQVEAAVHRRHREQAHQHRCRLQVE